MIRIIRQFHSLFRYINPVRISKLMVHLFKNSPAYFKHFKDSMIELSSFLLLFTVFLFNLPLVGLLKANYIPNFLRILLLKLNRSITMFVMKYDRPDMTRMNRLELFELAFRNMTFKKTRTIITIGGMALGVGAIVFLVSIGYGLQELVIDRVARLDEMRQADVSVQPGSNVKLSDKAVADFKEIKQVEEVLPLIGVVAKVAYQGSNSDVAVYGVTTNYLKNSAVKTINGDLFDSNEIGLLPEINFAKKMASSNNVEMELDKNGNVAGARVMRQNVKMGQEIQDITFSIFPRTWLRARDYPSTNSQVIGYVKRVEGLQPGKEYWGSPFEPEENGKVIQDLEGNWYGKWIKTQSYVWEEKACEEADPDCDGGTHLLVRDANGEKVFKDVYFAELEVVVNSTSFDPSRNNDVLGISDENTDETDITIDDLAAVLADESVASDVSTDGALIGTTSAGAASLNDDEYLSMLLESSGSAGLSDTIKVPLPPEAIREAVVNEAFLKVLGLDNTNPLGKEFSTSFIITSNLLENSAQKVESEPC
jgi:hypothetical protein